MPANYKGKVPKKVAIMHAAPEAFGQVELVQWEVFSGRDLADRQYRPTAATSPCVGRSAISTPFWAQSASRTAW